MAHNKKHHFVPRFYLKRFSKDSKSICLWNIKGKKKISSGNLYNQCYKDYFYGKELSVEFALGDIEGKTSEIFQGIDKFKEAPPFGSEGHSALLLYCLVQHARTSYIADALDEMNDDLFKHCFSEKFSEEGVDLSGIKVVLKEPAKVVLQLMVEAFPLILDLRCKLIRNNTCVDFITSDNPSVFYNQLFSFRKYGNNTGLANKGLQSFLPIDSKQLLVFYDLNSYQIGSKSKSIVNINSIKDVNQLNLLQMTAAYQNIYFENDRFAADSLYEQSSSFRREKKSDFDAYNNEHGKGKIITTSRKDVNTNLNLSFITVLKGARLWREKFMRLREQPVLVPRDKELLDFFYEFNSLVKLGHYKTGDFHKFIDEKLNINEGEN